MGAHPDRLLHQSSSHLLRFLELGALQLLVELPFVDDVNSTRIPAVPVSSTSLFPAAARRAAACRAAPPRPPLPTPYKNSSSNGNNKRSRRPSDACRALPSLCLPLPPRRPCHSSSRMIRRIHKFYFISTAPSASVLHTDGMASTGETVFQ